MKQKSNDEMLKAWRTFLIYWHTTEWRDVKVSKVNTIIGKYISFPIPKDINNPDVGNKFYISVKEVLNPFSTLERMMFDMYNQLKLGSTENEYCRFCKFFDKNLAGPIPFFHIGENVSTDKYGILFVGKNSWYDIKDYNEERGDECVADARDTGLLSLCRISNKSAYWKSIITVMEELYPDLTFDERIKNIAITNIMKCNTGGEVRTPEDKTPKEIRDVCIGKCGVIEKEIELLKPKRVIFMTGRDYDEYIKSFKYGRDNECLIGEGEDITVSEGNENPIRLQSRTFINKDGTDILFTLRISHPERKKQDKFMKAVLEWINNTVTFENEIKKIYASQTRHK